MDAKLESDIDAEIKGKKDDDERIAEDFSDKARRQISLSLRGQ